MKYATFEKWAYVCMTVLTESEVCYKILNLTHQVSYRVYIYYVYVSVLKRSFWIPNTSLYASLASNAYVNNAVMGLCKLHGMLAMCWSV
jgi:hypothetical protein